MSDYIVYHLHDDTSNCNGYMDSCSHFSEYIKLAKQQDMKAISFSNHGGMYDWIKKKQACDKAGIKYIHGIELYLCTALEADERGYHIGLYAKNYDGVKELNSLYSLSTSKGILEDKTDRHFYYNPRISIDELLNTSSNIIITTACLASILWRLKDNNIAESLLNWMSLNSDRCFLEIQYHNHEDQKTYNKLLYEWGLQYSIPLIAGTDTHSSSEYKAECRKILQKSKDSFYGQEDEFDLTWKTYDELIKMFKIQNALPEKVYMMAIHNTNKFADMVEDFELDKSFKYPNLYGENAIGIWEETINKKFNNKVQNKIIDVSKIEEYKLRIDDEFEAMKKQGMESFMMFMSELADYCNENNIPYGFCRGSVGGSVIAYITDIIDLDPIKWNTVFSRFCNADRISLADIDMDFAPEDRQKVYEFIIKKFTSKKTAYILTLNTLQDRGTIDVLAKGLDYKDLDAVMGIKNRFNELFNEYSKIIHEEVNLEELEELESSSIDFDRHDLYCSRIRNIKALERVQILKHDFEALKQSNKEIFYYFDGIKGIIISKGQHPAGIIGSPIVLTDNLGVYYKDGNELHPISICSMKSVDSLNFVKFDILGLKTIGIMKDIYEYIGSNYLKSHEINWNDQKVWDNMITASIGVFQFEGDYSFSLLKKFKPNYINDMSLVNAALRPSGKSYRDRLIAREFNKNPSKQIDKLLLENNGYLVYQEDTIKFLTDICGFTGSLADTTRRAIGKKDLELLNQQLPKILEGYCSKSDKPREIAEEEAKQFLKIIDDSSEYQFGYNHSTGYSMIGYACTRLRTYHILEMITAYLNRSETQEDIINGTLLAQQSNIKIKPIKFRMSKSQYTMNKEENTIYKGIKSIKYCNSQIAEELYLLKDNTYTCFSELLLDINNTSINSRQLDILIKLNFFSEFGNSKFLLKILECFEYLNNGSIKQLSIDKIEKQYKNKENFIDGSILFGIIQRHSTPLKNKTGKTYKELNVKAIMTELEEYFKCDIKQDFSVLDKIKFQEEFLGYIDLTTEKPEDRKKLLVLGVSPMISKKNKKVWAYVIDEMSIGSGIKNRLTIAPDVFNSKPLKTYDVIDVMNDCNVYKNKKGYWNLSDYQKIIF